MSHHHDASFSASSSARQSFVLAATLLSALAQAVPPTRSPSFAPSASPSFTPSASPSLEPTQHAADVGSGNFFGIGISVASGVILLAVSIFFLRKCIRNRRAADAPAVGAAENQLPDTVAPPPTMEDLAAAFAGTVAPPPSMQNLATAADAKESTAAAGAWLSRVHGSISGELDGRDLPTL